MLILGAIIGEVGIGSDVDDKRMKNNAAAAAGSATTKRLAQLRDETWREALFRPAWAPFGSS